MKIVEKNTKNAKRHGAEQIKLEIYPSPENVRMLRNFRHCRYVKRKWYIPLSHTNMFQLRTMGFKFNKKLREWYEKESLKSSLVSKDKKLRKTLFPFQIEGVNHIEACNGRALIADEMGLGKTIQALAWMKLKKEFPVLIICPSSLKLNWAKEAKKWLKIKKKDIQILSSRKQSKIYGKLVIINYDILPYWEKNISDFGFRTIILDEAHLIKSNQAKRTKAFKRINKGIKNLLVLTGTPIENKPVEFYNIIEAINPTIFGNYITYVRRYCNAKHGRFGLDVSGASNVKELHDILTKTVMIRRLKKDVLTDLPEKQINKIYLEIDNAEEYGDAEEAFITYVQDTYEKNMNEAKLDKELKSFRKALGVKKEDFDDSQVSIEQLKEHKVHKLSMAPALAKIAMLKQLAIRGKLEQLKVWIKEFLENNDKLVVFCIHKEIVDALMAEFPDAVKVVGGMSDAAKEESVESFQDGKARLFIGNIKAAGVGLTLTSASNVLIAEYPWTPGGLAQAIDRVHRITQLRQVTVWCTIASNTIEEEIIKLLFAKQKTISGVMDGVLDDDSNIFKNLMKSFSKPK